MVVRLKKLTKRQVKVLDRILPFAGQEPTERDIEAFFEYTDHGIKPQIYGDVSGVWALLITGHAELNNLSDLQERIWLEGVHDLSFRELLVWFFVDHFNNSHLWKYNWGWYEKLYCLSVKFRAKAKEVHR